MTRLLIAGGGTGGHLFPGVAIAEELRARQPDAPVLFVGTERGIEARVLPELGWELALIQVSGLKTVGALGAVRGLLRLPRALWQARRILRRFRPDAVIGVGGYASGPVVLMARLAGIPTAICEQNSIPGLTNKILGRLVRKVFLSFSEAQRFFSKRKIVMAGNPLRRDLVRRLTEVTDMATALTDTPADNSNGPAGRRPFSVLVCGGSLGAVAVNDLASRALIALAATTPLSIVHQTGAADVEKISARYREARVAATVAGFISDMASEYARADVIIARAGATTVAELAMAGKPAIFVPYPFAADNHQEHNAREMVDAGAALAFRQADLTAETLQEAIANLLANNEQREQMGNVMRSFARPHAAHAVVDWCDNGSKGS